MVKVKGSKDGTIITARFEGKSKSLFPTLKQTKALVLLSIHGNPFCTGHYLQAIIEKACAEHGFITFLIADEVYWHNLISDSVEDNPMMLKQQAVDMGMTYFEEQFKYFLQPLGISMNEFDSLLVEQMPLNKLLTLNKKAGTLSNFEVVFWRDWLNKSAEFNDKKNAIMALYDTEDSLKQSIEFTAADFAKRHHNKQESIDLLLRRSKNYLVEESPSVMWVAASLGYHFVVYPGEIIKPFEATRDYFIKNADCLVGNELLVSADKPHLLANWLEVSFVRSREKDGTSKKSYSEILDVNPHYEHIRAFELTAMMKGVTEGIFALDLDNEAKIQLVTDLLINYEDKKKYGEKPCSAKSP